MHNFVNMANLNNSRVSFDMADCLVDQTYRLPTLSEMIAECRRTGQMPYSNVRPIAPTETDDIGAPSYGALDKVDAAEQQYERMNVISDMENKVSELKKKQAEEKRNTKAQSVSPSPENLPAE